MSQLLLMYSDLGWMHKRGLQFLCYDMLVQCRSKKTLKKLTLTLNVIILLNLHVENCLKVMDEVH